MTNISNENIEIDEDEISLLDIIQFFIDNKVFIAASTFLCGALGLAYTLIATPMYEATMSIQMAMVANNPIEAPNLVVEKMKLPLYFSPSTWEVCDTDEVQTPSRTLAKKLNPVLNKNAPFIGLSYKAPSVNEAKACLQAVLDDIRLKQKLLLEPVIKQKQAHLQTLKAKLASAESVAKFLSSQKQDFQFKDEKFSANALILATRLSKDNEIKELNGEITDLEIALTPPQTNETTLAAPLFASPQHVTPIRALIVSLALLVGFMFGIFVVLGRKAWASIKPQLHA